MISPSGLATYGFIGAGRVGSPLEIGVMGQLWLEVSDDVFVLLSNASLSVYGVSLGFMTVNDTRYVKATDISEIVSHVNAILEARGSVTRICVTDAKVTMTDAEDSAVFQNALSKGKISETDE